MWMLLSSANNQTFQLRLKHIAVTQLLGVLIAASGTLTIASLKHLLSASGKEHKTCSVDWQAWRGKANQTGLPQSCVQEHTGHAAVLSHLFSHVLFFFFLLFNFISSNKLCLRWWLTSTLSVSQSFCEMSCLESNITASLSSESLFTLIKPIHKTRQKKYWYYISASSPQTPDLYLIQLFNLFGKQL